MNMDREKFSTEKSKWNNENYEYIIILNNNQIIILIIISLLLK